MSSGAGSSTNSTKNSSSLSAFLSTLIPVGVQAAAFVALFLIFRTKLKRVYRPRTYLGTLYDGEKTEDPPTGRFNWVRPWRSVPDEFVLNHQSLDGYLYLRFLKMLTVICFVGCCITWPVLFPVNATAGGGQKQFDLLSFSNVPKSGKNRYYAHVFTGWIFFSFVMYMITRETIYFINLRHAYLLSPFNAARISSRTVLFTDVPVEYLNQEKLHGLFGNTIARTWLATDCKDLEEKVEERDKDAFKLEGAEIKLIQTANKRRIKREKKAAKKAAKGGAKGGAKAKATADNGDAERAIPGSEFMKPKDRPTHKLGKIPLIGKKVDTIDWTRSELKRLVPEVEKDQTAHLKYEGKLLPAVFVEFINQQSAQAAFRRMSPKKAPKMFPRAIDATPGEIIWKNLKIKKTERLGRKFATNAFLTLMIIFWAIPVAVVGAISNINYLTDEVPFLGFINHIPSVILGVVTGLLPAVLLSILMSLVPIVCRWMSKLSGEVTLPRVELRCQSWYMAFQVIQVFLITTFSSGASSAVTSIINDPSSATTLLAQSLPKASNFYISYIIVQGMGIAAGNLLNIGSLVMLTVVGKFLDKSPRKMFKRFVTLAGLGWGSLYPQFGNMGIIAITYSIIAPLVMGFATIGFGLVYLAVRYNTFFVLTNNINTRGRAYARALQQLMTGVYLSEVCLIGLFAINTAPGPIVLMAVFLGATIIYHSIMRHALKPLMEFLPDSMDAESTELFLHADYKSYDASKSAGIPPSQAEPVQAKKFSAKKASFLQKMFDPKKFKSHQTVRSLVPTWPAPQYSAEEADAAYFNPCVTSHVPTLWIARDEMGISRKEVADSSEVVPITDEFAFFNEKNKVVWDPEGTNLVEMPIYEKRIDY